MSEPLGYVRDANGYLPIEAYGAIGNGRTVALVGSDGSIDWCPFSRIDRPTVFARILDTNRGGFWQIAPDESEGAYRVKRHYLDDTNILVTSFETDSGAIELIDMMPSIAFASDLGLNQRLWDGVILRFVRGVRGTMRVRQVMQPGFNYGRQRAKIEIIPERGALLSDTDGALRVASSIPFHAVGHRLVSEVDISEGEGYYASANFHGRGAVVWADMTEEMARELLDREVEGWKRWISRCTYEGPYADCVRRSALILKILDYLPSGAMVAAATTSLPEWIGGERNWDYRYAWIRDTSYALHALHSIGYGDEAEGFLQWVIDVTNDTPASLQIMYRVDGKQDLGEITLDHLEGYKKSAPVRIGNGAHDQKQLDRFGEVLDAAFVHRRFGGVVSGMLWDYLSELVGVIEERWRLPDSGIWEVRSGERRMTYSNVMCWVGVDRAIKLAEMDDRPAPLDRWKQLRKTIRTEIMEQGVSSKGYFSQGFGDDILDASALSFPLRNFIAVDHPVMRATIEAIERDLTENGLVWRYKSNDREDNVDGLAGHEGAFLLCTCWMIDCLTGLGRLDDAQALLDQTIARGNDLGLFAEEVDPDTGIMLGNFPQAFSHLGIINSIVNLGRACGEVHGIPDNDLGDVTGAIPGAGATEPETRP